MYNCIDINTTLTGMKQKINGLGHGFFITLLGLLVFSGCQEDMNDEAAPIANPSYSFKVLNHEQVFSQPQIAEKLIKFKALQAANVLGRGTVYNEEYDFTINTDVVKYLYNTQTGQDSYNFYISRDNPPDSYLENLVLNLNEYGKYEAYIVKYGFSKEEFATIDEATLNSKNTQYTAIDFDISTLNMGLPEGDEGRVSMDLVCVELWTLVHCDEGELNHPCGPDGMEWSLTSNDCTWISSGGGGSNGDGTGTGDSGTGGGGGGNGDPGEGDYDPEDPDNHGNGGNGSIITIPVLDEEDIEDPCTNIQNQINNEDYDDIKEELDNNFNLQEETGYSQSTDGIFTNLDVYPNGHSLSIPVLTNMVGFIHVHTKEYETGKFDSEGNPIITIPIKMPSPNDIITFLKLLLNAEDNDIPLKDIYVTMLSNTGNYTLRFTGDINDINIENLNPNNLKIEFKKYFKDFNNKEKAFLNFLKDKISINGISLYKIKNNGIIQKKSLKTNGQIDTQNCN